MTDALNTAYKSFYGALNVPGKVWADRMYPDNADASYGRPYVIYGFSAGGALNWTRGRDAGFLIDVVCVADSLGAALQGAGEIAALLDDQGYVDGGAVIGDSEWRIQTITLETKLHYTEPTEEMTSIITYSGGRYRVIMRSLT